MVSSLGGVEHPRNRNRGRDSKGRPIYLKLRSLTSRLRILIPKYGALRHDIHLTCLSDSNTLGLRDLRTENNVLLDHPDSSIYKAPASRVQIKSMAILQISRAKYPLLQPIDRDGPEMCHCLEFRDKLIHIQRDRIRFSLLRWSSHRSHQALGQRERYARKNCATIIWEN